MGGHDPYSSSQGRVGAGDQRVPALVLRDPACALASARAGNVIGGGDWGEDRLIPDVMRAAVAGAAGRDPQPGRDAAVAARAQPAAAATSCSPRALWDDTAPPAGLELRPGRRATRSPSAGSSSGSTRCGRAALRWEHDAGDASARGALPEGRLLPARARLGWAPRWDLERGARGSIVEWYAALRDGADMRAVTLAQLERFVSTLARLRAHDDATCRFCAAPLEAVVRRPRHVAAGELVPHAGAARTRWSRSIRCARSSARACFLVQLEEFESPEHIFSDYAYFSSYSSTWLEHSQRYVGRDDRALRARRASSQVVEIASNDGYLLQYFVRARHPGARHRAGGQRREVAAEEKGVPTLVEFFGVETARERRRRASRPTCCSATTCSPTCRTSTTSSAA